MHYAAWRACRTRSERGGAAAPGRPAGTRPPHSRASSFDGVESPTASTALLAGGSRPSEAWLRGWGEGGGEGAGAGGREGSATAAGEHSTHRFSVAEPGTAAAAEAAPLQPAGPGLRPSPSFAALSGLLWRPLEYGERSSWRWADWLRYWLFRWVPRWPAPGLGASCLSAGAVRRARRLSAG